MRDLSLLLTLHRYHLSIISPQRCIKSTILLLSAMRLFIPHQDSINGSKTKTPPNGTIYRSTMELKQIKITLLSRDNSSKYNYFNVFPLLTYVNISITFTMSNEPTICQPFERDVADIWYSNNSHYITIPSPLTSSSTADVHWCISLKFCSFHLTMVFNDEDDLRSCCLETL